MTGTAFPGHAPITITVSCLATGETVETHPLTIGTGTAKDPAWTIATGHDLPAERIAAALGGERVPCLDIVDFEVPAIQRYYEALRHDPLVRIEPRPGGRWGLEHTVTGCGCASDTWALPEQAVAHYRNLEHWSATRGRPSSPPANSCCSSKARPVPRRGPNAGLWRFPARRLADTTTCGRCGSPACTPTWCTPSTHG